MVLIPGMYHAGLSMEDRIAVQEGFMNGDFPVVITNAFGWVLTRKMFVALFIGSSLVLSKAYYQITGRDGKDQKRFYYTEMWIEKYKSFSSILLSNIRMYRKSLAGFTR